MTRRCLGQTGNLTGRGYESGHACHGGRGRSRGRGRGHGDHPYEANNRGAAGSASDGAESDAHGPDRCGQTATKPTEAYEPT